MAKQTLNEILENEEIEIDEVEVESQTQSLESENEYCVECTDMPGSIFCKNCDDLFCVVCFKMIHGSGKRKQHEVEKRGGAEETEEVDGSSKIEVEEAEEAAEEAEEAKEAEEDEADAEKDEEEAEKTVEEEPESSPEIAKKLAEIRRQAKFVPLRLTAEERELFRLLDSALNVSDYTNRVDIFTYTSKSKKIVAQLKLMCSILLGLVVSKNMKLGADLLNNKSYKDNEKWFQNIFEIGRRYKILNPNRFEDNFGKLMYMIMDSRLPEIKRHMEFDLYKPIKTIEKFLESRPDTSVFKMFDNPMIIAATKEIISKGKSRAQINREIKAKERAIEKLARSYSSYDGFSDEDIRQVLYSIGDLNAHVNATKEPLERMIERLQFFKQSEEYKLGISVGTDGARLSHTHSKQYDYVLSSLTLWSVIMKEMIHLWSLADDDLLDESTNYRLVETGQGLNRVKACPKLYREMYNLVEYSKRKAGFWVGSSYIHLGDQTVPNALFFLDKYLQVPKIINPIDNCLLHIDDEFRKDPFICKLIDESFGSVDNLTHSVLQHFFTKAFNGSGANDFFSAGSCVDGRLTSTWEWANQVHKYEYFKFFLLSGFNGFNG